MMAQSPTEEEFKDVFGPVQCHLRKRKSTGFMRRREKKGYNLSHIAGPLIADCSWFYFAESWVNISAINRLIIYEGAA